MKQREANKIKAVQKRLFEKKMLDTEFVVQSNLYTTDMLTITDTNS